MAIVSSPLKSEKARGSVGRTTYSVWRALDTARIRSVPSQPRTEMQMLVRNILSTLSRVYQTLTAAQVAAWRDYANDNEYRSRFGTPFAGSGLNAFLGCNFHVLRLEKPAVLTPPVSPPNANVASLRTEPTDIPAVGAVLEWTYFGTAQEEDYVEIQLTRMFPSLGRRAQDSDYRHVAYIAANNTTHDIVDLVDQGWYWTRVRYVSEAGQATPWMTTQFMARSL